MTGNRKLFAPDLAAEGIDQFAGVEKRSIAVFTGNMERLAGDTVAHPAAMDRDGRVGRQMAAVKNVVPQGIRTDLTGLFQSGFRSGRISFQGGVKSAE